MRRPAFSPQKGAHRFPDLAFAYQNGMLPFSFFFLSLNEALQSDTGFEINCCYTGYMYKELEDGSLVLKVDIVCSKLAVEFSLVHSQMLRNSVKLRLQVFEIGLQILDLALNGRSNVILAHYHENFANFDAGLVVD